MTKDLTSQGYDRFWNNQIAFITFNYDKSLEYFLYNSFYNFFYDNRIDIQKRLKDFTPFEIIHVYGSISDSSLSDWYNHSVDYFKDRPMSVYSYLRQYSENIRIIGERSAEVKDKLSGLYRKYKRIFFLGFGYAQENLEALGILNNEVVDTWEIFGTAMGMTSKEIADVKELFPIKYVEPSARYSLPGDKIKVYARIEHKSCYELLREYL